MYLVDKDRRFWFLALYQQGQPGHEIRCVVRRAKLEPLGNFMMGRIVLQGAVHSTTRPKPRLVDTLSGAYGGDGLTRAADKGDPYEFWPKMHPLPLTLTTAFWTDDTGHNDAGAKSGPLIRAWATERIKMLRSHRTVYELFRLAQKRLGVEHPGPVWSWAKLTITTDPRTWGHIKLDRMEEYRWPMPPR